MQLFIIYLPGIIIFNSQFTSSPECTAMHWVKNDDDTGISWLQRFCINVIKCGPLPKHAAFIMDGNRRWAERENILRSDGHVKGFDKLTECLSWCRELGILEVTVYAFSIENFKRSAQEINSLTELTLVKFQRLIDEKDKLKELGLCVRLIGKLSLLPADVRKLAAEIMLVTRDNTKMILNIAYSYTGREEITQAVSAVVSGVSQGKIDREDVSEQLISDCLYTSPYSYPDLLVRTSGEVRLSDFLLWQTPATYLHFTKTLWPDFTAWNMLAAIFFYQRNYDDLTELRQKEQRSDIRETRLNEFIAGVRAARDLSLV